MTASIHQREGRHIKLERNNPSNRDPRARQGVNRNINSQRPIAGQRPAGQRPAGQRPAGQRPAAQRSAGHRPASGQRPPQHQHGRRRANGRFPVFIAVVAALVIALVLIIVKPFSGRGGDNPPVVEAYNTVETTQPQPQAEAQPDAAPANDADLAAQLADPDSQVASLSADQVAQVTDLRIYPNLPGEWLNVLLLGTDERSLNDGARTDSMLICSINRNTGAIKLTSLMRDLAIDFTDIGKWNGTYRLNSASYFGGPNLAMRTVNEKFNMNIQYYVMVNFFGFQKIAQRLGGVDIDITKEEMELINERVYEQAKFAYLAGIDESDQENVYLETYGENTHLNGRMTLAYARLRKLTGGDAMRTERQRKVLGKLLEKVKQLDAMQMATLAAEMIDQVKTNMPLDDILRTALLVSGNGLSDIPSLRLPLTGTYKEETRNNQSMLYDCDFAANALALYNFIYED